MTNPSSTVGPYSTPPSAEDDRISGAIAKGTPESIEGLAWSKPDFSAPGHKIVLTFAIDRKKRPGLECIPCAMCCGHSPKFLDGAVLWSPDGYLRVIGHRCAAKPEHFGVGYLQLQKQRKQEHIDELALELLPAQIAALPDIISTVRRIYDYAIVIENQHAALRKGVRPLADLLEKIAVRDGGEITVDVAISETQRQIQQSETGMRAGQFESIRLGVLQGGEFFRSYRKKRSKDVTTVFQAFAMIPGGDPDEALDAIIDRGGEQAVTITAGTIFRATQRALRLGEQCLAAVAFMGEDNLTMLETWGADTRAAVPFTIQRTGDRVCFTLTEDRSRATILRTWPKPLDLTYLRQVVEAGVEFDKLLPKTLEMDD